MTIDWFVGFLEGEGCFGIHKQTNFPRFALGQKDREVLDKIAVFLQNTYQIYSKVYVNKKVTAAGKPTTGYILMVSRLEDNRKLYSLIHPLMEHPQKKLQLETKWVGIFEPRIRKKSSEPSPLKGLPVPWLRKLSEDQVKIIREQRGKKTCYELADQFGVSKSTILNVWNGLTYSLP